LRKDLTGQGLDAGPHTLVWHLQQEHIPMSPATMWRILTRHGAVVPDPSKRPKSSYRRFQAELPNQPWQSDFTQWQLADGSDVEILNWIDDHSRYLLGCTVHRPVTGPIVLAAFRAVVAACGVPAAVLTDNGLVYTTRFAGGRRGTTTRNGFETDLARLGVAQKNSSPNHPQTCGKVERFHQTLEKWLDQQPRASSLRELQAQLDAFREHYNTARPHRTLDRRTPAAAYTARSKATPTGVTGSHDRVRRDRIDDTGAVTIRYHGRLHHIGIGRTHARTHLLLLHPGPRHPSDQQSHRRTAAPARPGPHQGLPTPRPTPRPQTHKIRTLAVGSDLCVCRETSHVLGGWGSNPRSTDYEHS
jgi:transposase InsO family protein